MITWSLEERMLLYVLHNEYGLGDDYATVYEIHKHIYGSNGRLETTVRYDWMDRKKYGRGKMYRDQIEKSFDNYTNIEKTTLAQARALAITAASALNIILPTATLPAIPAVAAPVPAAVTTSTSSTNTPSAQRTFAAALTPQVSAESTRTSKTIAKMQHAPAAFPRESRTPAANDNEETDITKKIESSKRKASQQATTTTPFSSHYIDLEEYGADPSISPHKQHKLKSAERKKQKVISEKGFGLSSNDESAFSDAPKSDIEVTNALAAAFEANKRSSLSKPIVTASSVESRDMDQRESMQIMRPIMTAENKQGNEEQTANLARKKDPSVELNAPGSDNHDFDAQIKSDKASAAVVGRSDVNEEKSTPISNDDKYAGAVLQVDGRARVVSGEQTRDTAGVVNDISDFNVRDAELEDAIPPDFSNPQASAAIQPTKFPRGIPVPQALSAAPVPSGPLVDLGQRANLTDDMKRAIVVFRNKGVKDDDQRICIVFNRIFGNAQNTIQLTEKHVKKHYKAFEKLNANQKRSLWLYDPADVQFQAAVQIVEDLIEIELTSQNSLLNTMRFTGAPLSTEEVAAGGFYASKTFPFEESDEPEPLSTTTMPKPQLQTPMPPPVFAHNTPWDAAGPWKQHAYEAYVAKLLRFSLSRTQLHAIFFRIFDSMLNRDAIARALWGNWGKENGVPCGEGPESISYDVLTAYQNCKPYPGDDAVDHPRLYLHAIFESPASPLHSLSLAGFAYCEKMQMLHSKDVDFGNHGPAMNVADGHPVVDVSKGSISFVEQASEIFSHGGKPHTIMLRDPANALTTPPSKIDVKITAMICDRTVCKVCNPSSKPMDERRAGTGGLPFVYSLDLKKVKLADQSAVRSYEPGQSNNTVLYGQLPPAHQEEIMYGDGWKRMSLVCEGPTIQKYTVRFETTS